MDLGLRGKVVLIVGASGGIGTQMARIFSEEGAPVGFHYFRNRKWAKEICGRLQNGSFMVQADVRDRKSVGIMFEKVLGRFGKIDIVVANSGIAPPADIPIEKMRVERFDEVMAVNLRGPWLIAQAFFKVLKKSKPVSASLVFVGSTAGTFGEEGHSEYAASKAALVGLVRTLQSEIVKICPRGRVNMVAPGWTKTAMTKTFTKDEAAVVRAMQTRALKRIARPEEIARPIVLLASDRAFGYVTGQVLLVDGGMEGRVIWEQEEIDLSRV